MSVKTSKSKFKRTPEQQAIKNAVDLSTANLIVDAKAGVGKSTTIVDVAPKNSVILCFNKAPAEEMAAKLKISMNQVASTFHSYGLTKFPTRPVIDKSETHWLCQDELFHGSKPKDSDGWTRLSEVKKGVDWCKTMAVHPNDSVTKVLETLEDERLDLELPPAQIAEDVLKILCASAEITTGKSKKYWRTDFAGMQWKPFVHGWGRLSVDHLYIDEAQDLNPIRLALTLLWGNRKCAVGDVNQAIYAWNGSMSDSLSLFQKATGARELPLTVCWRCPSSHLDLARELVPEIKDRPNCPVGTLNYLDTVSEAPIDPERGALILCRTNAPLVRQYYQLRSHHNQPVVMMSSDIAETLRSWVGSDYESKSKLDATWEAKYQKKLDRKLKYAKSESSRMVIQDHDAAIQLIRSNHSEMKTIGEFHNILTTEFAKPEVIPDNAIRLSSIHGSKGLEHHNVVIYGTSQIPHPMATEPWARDQEKNLLYVARTRSMDTLSMIPEL